MKTQATKAALIARIIAFTLLALWMAFIFFLSARPAKQSSEDSGKVIEHIASAVEKDYESFTPQQKKEFILSLQSPVRTLAHFSEYGVLGILAFCAALTLSLTSKKRLLFSFLLCVAYSVTDEIHQLFVSGRAAQLTDILVDTAGAILGILFVVLIAAVIKRIREVSCRGKA